jgi:bis(5'-nucleosyl)-tetraphosphatase (symmetrical)
MADYAVGDIQGCHNELLRLLDKIRFHPDRDHLYCVGDLVNRGPDSLGVLRTIKALKSSATCVLGNHDLHLISIYAGIRKHRKGDSLKKLLKAPDADELIDWLRHRPLLHVEKKQKIALCHAGIYPGWSIKSAKSYAREVEAALQKDDYHAFLAQMYGNRPALWKKSLHGYRRLRFIVNAFTRMRYCTRNGALVFRYNGAPGTQPGKLYPWYSLRDKDIKGYTIIFGHWSTLGTMRSNLAIGLDTGCIWGGPLTAVRLDRPKRPFIKIKSKK